jgi:putative endopeptidase
VQELIENIKTALRARFAKLDWMEAATKKAAYAKLDTLVTKIGYPDRWRDYSRLDISRGSYYDNIRASRQFEARQQMSKIGKPVDRTEWGMLPQMVNAYYSPSANEMVFSAAQLQPPFFEASMDSATNYGGIGSAIGHELLHGFDDNGSQFDAQGNYSNWWAKADREAFEARTEGLVKQFNSYAPVDNLHINGKLTLGENISDLGGLHVAWDAWQLTKAGRDQSSKADNIGEPQRFFLSFAQAWRTAQRPELTRLQLRVTGHAPAKWRVLGPLSNMPEFARTFSCKAGDAVVRPESTRVSIW